MCVGRRMRGARISIEKRECAIVRKTSSLVNVIGIQWHQITTSLQIGTTALRQFWYSNTQEQPQQQQQQQQNNMGSS
jgi:hypothetical protein